MQSVCVEIKAQHPDTALSRLYRWGADEAVLGRTVQARLDHHPGKDDDTPSDSGASVRHDQVRGWEQTHFSRNGCRRWQPRWRFNVLAYNIKLRDGDHRCGRAAGGPGDLSREGCGVSKSSMPADAPGSVPGARRMDPRRNCLSARESRRCSGLCTVPILYVALHSSGPLTAAPGTARAR